FFFFFQAEDGIRYPLVTGVQTCALPISPGGCFSILGALDQPPVPRLADVVVPPDVPAGTDLCSEWAGFVVPRAVDGRLRLLCRTCEPPLLPVLGRGAARLSSRPSPCRPRPDVGMRRPDRGRHLAHRDHGKPRAHGLWSPRVGSCVALPRDPRPSSKGGGDRSRSGGLERSVASFARPC